MSLTVDRPFHVTTADHGRSVITPAGQSKPAAPKREPPPAGRLPRITRLMALAIKFNGYVHDGVVADYAELARLGHVTRARITQIMDPNLLAPDIQAAILGLPRTVHRRDPIGERHIRPISALSDWNQQRARWRRFVASTS